MIEFSKGNHWFTFTFALALLCFPYYKVAAHTAPMDVNQQVKVLRGRVLDDQGEPLPGASIQIKGGTKGVITDMDGNFEFMNVPLKSILIVSFVGMQDYEATYNGEANLTITMKSKVDELEEVTVVAFARQKKESVVASIATLNPDALKIPTSNLTTAMAGRIGGLISYQSSGEPGQDNADFFVRGVMTFSEGKKDPLILIDNIEVETQTLVNLNPDDIASFSILKDATATSLYGARGANGVIMVTTKQGREGKISVSARIENSFSRPTEMVKIADPVTYMRMHNEAIKTRNPNGVNRYTEEKIAMTEAGRYPTLFPALNWYDIMLKDVTTNQRGNVNLSGGTTNVRYFVSGNISHDTGNIRVDKRNNYNSNINIWKYAFRSNIDINLTKTTLFYLKLYAQFEDYSGPLSGGTEAYRSSMQANPVLFQPYYAPDEQYADVKHVLYGNYGDGNYVNPYAVIQKGYKEYSRNQTIVQLGFNQKLDMITPGLNARLMLNIDRYNSSEITREWSPYYYGISSYNLIDGSYRLKRLKNGGDGLDFNDKGRWITNAMYLEAAAEYSRKFVDKHNVNGLLVYTMRQKKYSDDAHNYLEASLPYRNIGLAGRLAYNYDDRYMIEGNFGLNGSERFSKANRWGFFPAIGAGWVISNEPWAGKVGDFFNVLKLKVTYGLAGNDQIGSDGDRFYYMSNVNNEYNSANFGTEMNYTPGKGFKVNRYANDKIGWETSRKLNLGIEYETKNGFRGYVEYFREQRDNILLNRIVPATTGLFQEFKANLGEAEGWGFDAELNYEKNINKNLWLTGRATFTFARSKAISWEEPDYSETPWVAREGKHLNTYWGFIAERLFLDDEEVKNSPTQFGDVRAGDIKYRDVNGDGKITDLDKVPIGYPTVPEINYGFGLSAGYKNFDISCFFVGSARSSFALEVAGITPFHNIRGDDLKGENAVLQMIANNYWSESNQNPYAFWPRLDTGENENNSKPSTWWIQDKSYLRLKSVELGYSLPQKLMKRIGMNTFRVYLSGTNLLCWSKFKLWDPELGGNGLNYPLQRVFNVGVNLSF